MKIKKVLSTAVLVTCLLLTGLIRTMGATVFVNSNITTPTTWTPANVYVLVGIIYVTNNTTLTIQPGTLIKGDSATLGSLVITSGAKLIAVGTACSPIVFTSEKGPGFRKRGDWGAVILLGYAAVNWPGDTGHIEGIVPNPNTRYGGGLNPNFGGGDHPDDHDNSGDLEYVRIEFAGVALSPNNEINGLTFGGVGDGTIIDHIQVSFANDDSYEWFGGHVNCKHLIAFRGIDDDFDTDNGYSGKDQFLVSLRDPVVADVSGSKGFESDNDPTDDLNLPQTRAIFCNVDVIAGGDTTNNPLFVSGAHIRRNSHMYAINDIIMGWPAGLLIDGTNSQNNALADTLVINSLITCKFAPKYVTTASPAGTASVIDLLQNHAKNQFFSGNAGVKLTNPYNLTGPDFRPATGSPALSGAEFSSAGLSDPFFQHVSYIGAFDGTNDWTDNWANWDPVNTVYGKSISNAPKVTGTVTSVICPNSGGVTLTTTGGVGPFGFTWSNGQTTQNLTNVPKGMYTVTVQDHAKTCTMATKNFTVKTILPQLTTCSSTSSSVTVFWSGNIAGSVTGYQIHHKLHSATNYGAYTAAGNGNSFTVTGLLSGTQYDFQIRGICTAGFTGASAAITCSTTLIPNQTVLSSGQLVPTISISPNPSSGKFNVEFSAFANNVSVKVINLAGQLVYSVNSVDVNSTMNMDLSNLANGLYTIEATDGINLARQEISIVK